MCLVMYYQYYNRNFVLGREHGSAEWADPKQVMASKGDKQGRILSQHITLSKSGKKIANNNMIVVGALGTGKSFQIVAPNLICCGMMLQLLCWMLKGIFYEIMEKPWKRMDIK